MALVVDVARILLNTVFQLTSPLVEIRGCNLKKIPFRCSYLATGVLSAFFITLVHQIDDFRVGKGEVLALSNSHLVLWVEERLDRER